MPLQLLIGLGNPGKIYANTRHNMGSSLVEQFAQQQKLVLRTDAKFKGLHGSIASRLHLLIPTTFMNASGQAVLAVSHFYNILPKHILIVHDELALNIGDNRLKFGGGHAGHNGLRDIINHLGTADFNRLRIGIGHPGARHLVHDYVLSAPSAAESAQFSQGWQNSLRLLTDLLADKFNAV